MPLNACVCVCDSALEWRHIEKYSSVGCYFVMCMWTHYCNSNTGYAPREKTAATESKALAMMSPQQGSRIAGTQADRQQLNKYNALLRAHTHMYTRVYIYRYICVCACVFVYCSLFGKQTTASLPLKAIQNWHSFNCQKLADFIKGIVASNNNVATVIHTHNSWWWCCCCCLSMKVNSMARDVVVALSLSSPQKQTTNGLD